MSDLISALPDHLRDAYEVLAAGAAQILPADGLAERLLAADKQGRPLRVKFGIDPSGTDLTLGHAVILRKLRQFQDFGHTAVLIVGGFTAQVGDPTGKTTTRAAQSAQQVMANAEGYFEQVMQILDRDRIEVVNNADWLGTMDLAGMLDYTRQVTVAQLLERDDFAKRYATGQPISLSEFFYPLLQGIDSVAVHSDLELGGTDQTFNNLVGRELQKAKGQPPQTVLTMPLLVGTDGTEKMSKSLGNYIAIAEPAAEQFGKLMSIPDSAVAMYAQLCTALHPREVAELAAQVSGGGIEANHAKRRMAREVVALYHSVEAATAAEARFDAVFKRGEVLTDAPEHVLAPGDPVHLPALLVAAGLSGSTSAARRSMNDGAVKIDGERLNDLDVPRAMLEGKVLSVGKRRTARIV